MKKGFVKVMLFGALVLATSTAVTSCKDYDDDVKNLQGQIDNITSKNSVSVEDMKTAIASAISTLQAQLQKAIDGKADNADVKALQEAVKELETALENKADQSKITELAQRITDLSAKVNSLEGSLSETKKALEGKIAELEAKLANTVSQEEMAKITQDLAAVKNELAIVKEMAEDNAAAIARLVSEIEKLKNLETRIAALEEANKAFAAKADLNAYTKTSEMATLISGEVAKYLKDDGQIAKYVNEVITTKVLAETSAINVRIKGIDTKLSELSTEFTKFTNAQTLTNQDIIRRLEALEDYQNAIKDAITKGGYKDFAAVLQQIADLKADYGKCITTDNLGASVNAYLKTALSDSDSEFGKLAAAVEKLGIDLNAMIQSVVYIPTNKVGTENFTTLYAKRTANANFEIISKTTKLKVSFRVSPASAAENFKEKYDVLLDGQVITRSTTAFTIAEVENDPSDKGIINVTIKQGDAAASYAVSLMIKSKAPAAGVAKPTVTTDVTSNYFPVLMITKYMQAAKVVTVNGESDNDIYYDTESDQIDYSKAGKIQIMATNSSNETGYSYEDLDNNPTYEGVDKSMFTIQYSVSNATNFVVSETGMVGLKEYNLASYVGKTSEVMAKVKPIANVYLGANASAKLGDVTVKKTVRKNEYTYSPSIKVTWSNSVQNVAATNFPLAKLYDAFNITDAEFRTLTGVVKDPNANVKFEVATDGTNALTASIAAAVVKGTYPVEVVFTSADGSKVYTVKANIDVDYPVVTQLTVDPLFWAGSPDAGQVQFTPTLNDPAKPSAITTTYDLSKIFKNYAAVSNAIDAIPGASLTLKVKCGTGATAYYVTANQKDGLSYNATTLNIDKATYAGKAISVEATVKFGINAVQELAASISIRDISGTWIAGSKAVTLTDKAQSVDLATGFSWTDLRGKTMWNKDGVVVGSAKFTDFAIGTNALDLYGLNTPSFYFVNAAGVKISSDKYLQLSGSSISFTTEGKNYSFQESYMVRVKVDAKSQWGTIKNYAGNDIITVTVQKGL